ncbi:armadillo-type protein [Glomus cerebriforme]|uniref:Armadillo-type protein n=1 Tax=Glomus cerebriforme TaxID=658196 RepID=A0A397SP62_9GLOM|nr:armadillo-type protein [Glomus cerebriforme]
MASPRVSSASTGRDSPNPTTFNDPFQFDEHKFASYAANPEKQELYVFNWLANLERELKKTDKETIKQCQTNLEKQLLRFISLITPKPHRPIRQLVARIFVVIYIKGESRTLFDTITALQSLVGVGKNVGEKETKLAALHCIGIILKSLGDRILSLVPETINICLKTIKNSSNALIVRLEAIYTINRSLEGAGKGTTESIVKDIMKQMRSGLGDKALIIKVASVQCMHAVAKYTHQQYPITANELDNLLNQMVKLLDGSNQTIRRSVSSYIATLLAGTQTEVDFLAISSSTSSSKKKSSTTPQASGDDIPALNSQQSDSSSSSSKVILSVEEMLTNLSTIYNKQSTSREMRAAIIETYSALFLQLGTKYVELNYSFIAQHLLKDLVSHSRNSSSRYEALNVREHCELLLRDVIGTRLLSEQGQVTAVRELANGWLKQWSALTTNQVEPSKLSLVCAVNEISGLLLDLGGAASTVFDVVADPLVTLLSHTSYSVQIATAWCLRCLCYSLPIKLSGLITKVHGLLNKDLNNLTNQLASGELPKRTIGYAYGLAALLSVIPSRPLDVSFELSARVFSLSTQLIKTSANKDLAVASVQIQVAWILIGSLMSLGPNFVKLHLPQLLIFWKMALPKNSNRESISNKSESEWSFMFHVRECVLGAMLSFLLHNSKLVTADVSKRLVALLNNALTFTTLVPSSFSNNLTPNSSAISITPQLPFSSLKFSDRENMLKRRIFQCFVAIRPISAYDNLSTQLLKLSVSQFADPEKNVGSAITAAIAAAVSGSFTSVWTTGDEYAYGVTSRLQGMNIDIANPVDNNDEEGNGRKLGVRDWLNRDLVESRVENQLEQPIIGAPEYDSLMIYTTYWLSSSNRNNNNNKIPKPVPAATASVDYSLELFGLIFPTQSAQVQEIILDQLIKSTKHPRLEKSPGRKMAVQVNMVIGLLAIFKNIMNKNSCSRKGDNNSNGIADKRIESIIMDMLQDAIIHPDPYLRNAASEALGRLLSIVGGNLVTTQMQLLVDQVVNNRDPDTRAGSALALGCIYSHVGGMAAGSHLKTLVGILLSLSSDPHPVVHFWALYALAKVIESAGLMFSQYVSSTLGIIAKLYMADTHEPGGGSVGTTNVGLGFSAYQQFGKIIYGLIGTLGPELQSSAKVRNLCLNLMIELRNDEEQMVVVESIRCLQHFIMFAQQFVDLPRLVAFLQFQLSSKHLPLKEVAVTCLYQLVQKNAKHVFEVAVPGLDNQLFSLLDTDPTIDGVKDIVKSWLNQTAIDNPSIWVELCRKVMSKTGSVASAGAPIEPPSLDLSGNDDLDGNGNEIDGGGDEENLDVTAERERTNAFQVRNRELEKNTKLIQDSVQIPPRWRTQLFALQCLHQVVEVISNSGDKDHFDLAVAKKKGATGKDYLVMKVQELIKMAFTASTAVVSEMRLEGLTVLRDVIEKFAATPDPDFEEAALLEQYQAQIGAALTPAFTAESSPEILSAAVKVCAVFVGSGIVKELYRMGRILKLLTTALENCKDNISVTTVGDVKDLSPHAAIMIKLSVLNAWAELQVSSIKQSYLIQVIEPNLSLLCPLWVSALKEYARIQIEPDIAEAQINNMGNGRNGGMRGDSSFLSSSTQTEVFDSMYSGLTREVILPYYNMSWLTILGAVASLVESGNPLIISALNGKDPSSTTNNDDVVEFTDFGDEKENVSSFDDFTDFTTITETSIKKVALKDFFILFGLCVEALSQTFGGSSRSSGLLIGGVNSGGNNSPSSNENDKVVKTCINALKAFLRPIVAGTEFLEKKMVIELINLFDRLILTEGFKVQYDIIQIIANIINDYGSTYLCEDLLSTEDKRITTNGITDEENDTTTNDDDKSQTVIFYILRLLVNIFFQKVPSLSTRPASMRIFRPPQGNARGQTSQQTHTVLKASIEAFTSLIIVIPIKYKNDLIAIAFYIFISIIQDPKFQQNDIIQNVLYNIKLLCDGGNLEKLFNEEKDFNNFSKIIHSSIWSILTKINSLLNSEKVEYNEEEVSIIKNCLLATVLLFTCNPKSCLKSKETQTGFIEILKKGFQSNNTTISVTSLQCIRTLILLSTKSKNDATTSTEDTSATEISHNFIKALIPQLVVFLQNIKESKLEQNDEKFNIIEEVIKTLLMMNTVANDSHKSLVIAVTLPTLINLLENPPLESFDQLPQLHSISVKHILSLATNHPLNFKDAIAVLTPQLKSKLENAIRFNVLQEQAIQQRLQQEREKKVNEQLESSKGPSIILKNDFSGFS